MTALIPIAAMAMEWTTQRWADLRAGYSDNVQLIPGSNKGTEDYGLSVGWRLAGQDERGYLRLMPSLKATRYAGFETFDSDTQTLDGMWSHSSERAIWQLSGGWGRDSTLTSELPVSGLVRFHQRSLRRRLAPSFSYALTERSSVAMDLAYATVKYSDAALSGLTDYRDANASLSWSYRWSERSTITSSLYDSRYDAERIGNHVQSFGGQMLIKSAITDRWDGVFGAGMYRSHREGWLLNLGLVRKDELGQWSLDMSRTVDPSGTGVLVQQDQWSIVRQRNLSPLWHLDLSGSLIINKDLQGIAGIRNRRYRSVALNISRTLTPNWSAVAGYTYDSQIFAGESGRAERNAISIGIHYSENE